MTINPQEVLAALGFYGATVIGPVPGGWDTAIWRVDLGGREAALRVFRAEQERACQREVIGMQTAASGGIPAPCVYAEGKWRERPALLISWCSGRRLMEELLSRPWRVWSLGRAFGQMQGRLHSISAPESLRELDGDWTVWIGPEEDWLWERLRADELDANALLHIDYHPLNVLTNGAKITAVLDWTCVRIGPPRADVARTFALLRMVPLTSSGTPLHIQGFRRLLALAWHSGYEQVAGKLGQMAPYYAWAGSFTARDLAAKIGRPNIWLEQRHLNSIRRWTAQQRRLAMSERR